MKLALTHGSVSNIFNVVITGDDGAPETGLTFESTGLIISTITDNEATATNYTVAAGNVETIATLGTFAAPTAGKCRFREVDATNHPGMYQIMLADARFAITNARVLYVSISGVANTLATYCEIQLEPLPANIVEVLGTAPEAPTGGRLAVNAAEIGGVEAAATNLAEAYENGLPFLIGQVHDGVTPTTTAFETDTAALTSQADDFFNNGLITFLTGALQGITCRVSDYVAATNVFTVSTLPSAPIADDWFILVGRQTA